MHLHRRRLWLTLVGLALLASMVMGWRSYASAGAHHARDAAKVVLSKSKLEQLGLARGPDSIAARYVGPAGKPYLVFTASSKSSPHRPYHLYRVALGKKQSAGSLSLAGKPQLLLSPGATDHNPVPWCATTCFDATYSGGGTLLQCPNNGPLLMTYHGENHLNPSGEFVNREGWSGIGLARWDPTQRRFVKIDQIVGMNATNRWRHTTSGWETWQAPPLIFQGDMVLNPVNKMVYLYYGDKLPNPNSHSGGRVALAAIPQSSLCSDAAAGVHAPWMKWWKGSFRQPAVYTNDDNPHLPAGTGGRFTPILPTGGESSPDVIYRHGTWYMVTSTQHTHISLRTSRDGINWSSPKSIYKPQSGIVMYPYIWTPSGQKGKTAYVTFTWYQFKRPAKGNCALKQIQIQL
jgi:hypothetical protein